MELDINDLISRYNAEIARLTQAWLVAESRLATVEARLAEASKDEPAT